MSLEQNPMGMSPERALSRNQDLARERAPFEDVVRLYLDDADAFLDGKDSVVLRDELGRFAKGIASAPEGVDLEGEVNRLFNALRLRRVDVPDSVDTKRERAAFGTALARAYIRSVH